MKLPLLLALLTVSEGGGSSVVGVTGEDVSLTCTYDHRLYGPLSVCWVRGTIPTSGCGDLLISTRGGKVTGEGGASSRYRLLGRLEGGDVSLTILNISETDAGPYGCRVEIPGLFNDYKHQFDLTVERSPQMTTSTTFNRETSTEQTDSYTTAGQLTSTERRLTSSSSSITAEEASGLNVVLLCVLFGLVALLTVAAAIVIIASRRRRLNKASALQLDSSARFSSSALQSRGSVVENIYQMDGDGGEYEYVR
ncbi:T-cell immunoglobulin and mucin domain-containing protein 4-like [Cottoperca gobio]|uniref:T-cell immunoglobulin and mucin domain-containing protein 4-like n=1 Tax=Cottoperca gobio TaxID=56716 RepID=UPI00110D8ABE|nr:T-cell immunoglobulin and mucin domain-containing protein 4-like [Cottoperca gobio]